jgi:hypothetical protein
MANVRHFVRAVRDALTIQNLSGPFRMQTEQQIIGSMSDETCGLAPRNSHRSYAFAFANE